MQELIWRLHHLSQPLLQEETSKCSQDNHLHFFLPPVSGSTIIWHPPLPGSDIVTVLVCSAGVVVWQEGKQECLFSAQCQGYFTGIVAVSFADTIWPKLQMNSISSPTDPPKSELQSLSWTMQKNTGADISLWTSLSSLRKPKTDTELNKENECMQPSVAIRNGVKTVS